MRTAPPLRIAALTISVLSLLSGRAFARTWATVYPSRVDPGGVFEVKAGDTERPAETARASFLGQHVELSPLNGVLRALLGVPASLKAGAYPVSLTIHGRQIRTVIRVKPKVFPSQNIHMKPGKTKLMDPHILARERAILDAAYDHRTKTPLWTGSFLVPAAGPHTSAWGRRRTVNGRHWGQHQGADIAAATGTPIAATNAGRVAIAQKLWMRGNTVVIDHGFGVFSTYNHLSRIDVRPGESVSRGQRIGLVGATGFVTGPHLHWELRIGPISVDPWPIVRNGLPLG